MKIFYYSHGCGGRNKEDIILLILALATPYPKLRTWGLENRPLVTAMSIKYCKFYFSYDEPALDLNIA